jgi:RimJ/RimL family protein N-acetyltransferase
MHWSEGPEAFDRNRILADLRLLPDDGGWVNLAVAPREDGFMIGDLGVRLDGADGWLGLSFLPEHRRRGFGRELMTGAMGWLAGRGACRFIAEIDEGNAASHALFLSLGFAVTGREEDEHGPFHVLTRHAA